jgi:hypothetical protein
VGERVSGESHKCGGGICSILLTYLYGRRKAAVVARTCHHVFGSGNVSGTRRTQIVVDSAPIAGSHRNRRFRHIEAIDCFMSHFEQSAFQEGFILRQTPSQGGESIDGPGSTLDSHQNGRALVAALNRAKLDYGTPIFATSTLNLSYVQGPPSLGNAIRMCRRYINNLRRISHETRGRHLLSSHSKSSSIEVSSHRASHLLKHEQYWPSLEASFRLFSSRRPKN